MDNETKQFLVEQFEKVDKRFEKVEEQFENIDKRFEKIDKQFENADKRFDQVDQRFDTLEVKVDDMQSQLNSLEKYVIKIHDTGKQNLTQLDLEIVKERMFKNEFALDRLEKLTR